MSATIKISGMAAVIDDDLVWTCEDPVIADALNLLTAMMPDSGADPNPPLTRAEEAIRLLGGEVVSFDPTEDDELIINAESA